VLADIIKAQIMLKRNGIKRVTQTKPTKHIQHKGFNILCKSIKFLTDGLNLHLIYIF